MRRKFIAGFIISIIVLFLVQPSVFAQETFGPTCEVGITCAPTPSATTIPQPTQPPASTAIPPRPTLLVTGTMETTYAIFGVGAFFLIAGVLGLVSFRLGREQV